MRSQRGGGPGSSILAAVVVLLSAATSVRAQPGFGLDPFWPYNNQYTPYTTSIGPATPGAGGRGTNLDARDGLRNANQFQNYVDNLSGPGRNVSDRSNVGVPYFQSAANPTRGREYLPNRDSSARGATFQEAQSRMADLHFRYYEERDPSRRGELLREYREARRDASVALFGRGRSPSRPRESAPGPESGLRRESRTIPAAPRPSSAVDRTRSRRNDIGAAPEIPALGGLRSSSPRARRDLPSDILNRSEAMDARDRTDRVLPSPGSPGLSTRPRRPGLTRPAPTDPSMTPPADSDRP